MKRRRYALAILLVAHLPPLAGIALVAYQRQYASRPVAELEGLLVALDRADWLRHEMLDGPSSRAMPSSMVPDMPPQGSHRLSVELTASNPTPWRIEIGRWRLLARTPSGEAFAPSGALPESLALSAGQRVVFDTRFDVPETAGAVALEVEANGRATRLFESPVPKHEPDAGGSAPARMWPADVAELPRGDARAGRALFSGRLACFTCHGHPELPSSNLTAPHLGELHRTAKHRVAGKSAAQYVYESILDPNAFIAPICAGGQPCASPSAMPFYGEVLSLQEMADLVAFLTEGA